MNTLHYRCDLTGAFHARKQKRELPVKPGLTVPAGLLSKQPDADFLTGSPLSILVHTPF
jgi:hypothetical protein